jgi:hypothetical protein
MTTVGELVDALSQRPREARVTLVIDDNHHDMQSVCSGEISVDIAELNTNNEIMLVGDEDT